MPDTPKGLYLPGGGFLDFNAESLTTEIATRKNAGLSLGGEMGLWLNQLPDPDPILRKRGDDAAVLKELAADDQVTVAMLGRKNRVLNCPHFAYRAGAPDGETVTPEAQLAYDRLSLDLERTSLRDIVSGILDAPFYGMTPLEITWESQDGWWHIKDIVARPFHWFAYDDDNKPFFRGEKGWSADPQYLPDGKFVIVSHHADYDNPYGLRLLSRCLWPVAFKRGGSQFYAKFVEKYGLPWTVGNAPPRASRQDKRDMANDLARMVQDCVSVLPAGASVQLLAPSGGQDAVHERFLDRQDRTISKLLMGQTLTVEMEGVNNSQAAATTHNDVAEGLADSDKAMVAHAMNEIAWAYTQVNLGPKAYAPLFSYEEPEDLLTRAQLDKALCEMGVEFKASHFEDNYNLKSEEFTIRPRQPGFSPFAFSAPKGKTASAAPVLAEQAQAGMDTAIADLLPQAVKANDAFINGLLQKVRTAKSFDEIQFALADALAPTTEPTELEAILHKSMLAAAGYGAAAVHAEGQEE